MNTRDFALVSFTILTQMSVGAFLVLGAIHFFVNRKAGIEQADRMSDRALLAIGPLLVLGLLASLLHLGNPVNAPRAVMNLGTSWLSREILFSLLFAGVGGVFAVMQWRKLGSPQVRNVIAWIAALIGVVLVFSMSNIYMIATQPVWNNITTPISFYTTALLLGLLAVGAALVANYAIVRRREPDCVEVQCQLLRDTLRWVAIASMVALGVEFVVVPVYLSYLSTSVVAVGAAQMLASQFTVLLILRLALAFIGAGILGAFLILMAGKPGKEQIMGNLAYGAFALVLIAEVMGRFLFYATHIPIRL